MLKYSSLAEEIDLGIQNPAWTEGPTGEELDQKMLEIENEAPGRSRRLLKADMMSWILRNGAIASEEHGVYADRLRHEGAILRVQKRWIADETTRGKLGRLVSEAANGQNAKLWEARLDTSHTCPDWERILRLGITGLSGEIKKKRKDCPDNEFYQAAEMIYDGISDYLKRLIALRPDAPYSVFLRELLLHAPATTPEALELMLLYYMLQDGLEQTYVRSFGHLDLLLWSFYQEDLKSGRYSKEEFCEYLKCFFARISAMDHPNNVPICLGSDPAVYELTELIRETYDSMGIYCPKIQIRVHDRIPEEFLLHVMNSIRSGRSSYVFVNDRSVIPALTALGIRPEDAASYIPVGCYEPNAFGEVPNTCAGNVNMTKCVLLAMNNGRDPKDGIRLGVEVGEAEAIESYEAFEAAVLREVDFCIRTVMDEINAYEEIYIQMNPASLFSSTMASCVERGLDAYEGGAIYSNTSINMMGLADITDALCAIKHKVYEENELTLSEFRKILKNNWEDAELLRKSIRTACPRFGNGDPEADALAEKIAAFSAERINGAPAARGGVFRMGLFSIDVAFTDGLATSASPDGRFFGDPLSKNLCATVGSDRKGPTALLNTVSRLTRCGVPNGAVLDLVLHPSAVKGEPGLQSMLTLLKVFEKNGGQCLQMNIFDTATLREAQAFPEKYETLQVRVCGWNARFTRLSRTEQDVFIAQAENSAAH